MSAVTQRPSSKATASKLKFISRTTFLPTSLVASNVSSNVKGKGNIHNNNKRNSRAETQGVNLDRCRIICPHAEIKLKKLNISDMRTWHKRPVINMFPDRVLRGDGLVTNSMWGNKNMKKKDDGNHVFKPNCAAGFFCHISSAVSPHTAGAAAH